MRSTLKIRRDRRGLTLVELVVVLAILAALAGLILPLAGTYLQKAHASSAADGIKEVSKVFQQYNAVTRQYPNGLDSLTNGTAALDTRLPAASGLTARAISIAEAASLAQVGITQLAFSNGTGSATFSGTDAPANITGGTTFGAEVTPGAVLAQLGYGDGATGEYLAFGVGHQTQQIGEWIQEAPFHFPEAGNPNDVYSRYAAVFDVTTAGEPAVFVGVVAIHPNGVEGIAGHLEEFFEN